jgi:G3E family GTPase
MNDDIAEYYRLDAVITVVDAKHGMRTLDQQTEAQKQVGFADHILISKQDLVNPVDYEALRARLVQMNPRAPITPVHFGNIDLHAILDLQGFNLNAILDIDPHFLAAAHPDAQAHEAKGESSCQHGHHHPEPHHDEIAAFVFRSYKPFDPARLEEFLSGVVQVYGADLLRYKGILYMKGVNRRMLFQGVHMMMGAEPGKPWSKAENPSSKMVFIGRKLPQAVFTQGLEQCLAA